MKPKTTNPLFLVAFGVALFALSMNLRAVLQVLGNALGLVSPILVGLVLAFVLNVPMSGFERLLSRRKVRPPKRAACGLSLMLTLLSITLVIVLAFTMLIPTLASSAGSIAPLLQEKWPEWLALLNGYGIDTSLVTDWLAQFDLMELPGSLDGLGGLFSSLASGVKSTVSVVTNAVFGLVIAVYILLSKNQLGPQAVRFLQAYLRPETADRLLFVARLSRETYTKFLTGQCVEAVILGTLIFLSFSAFRLPYAALIGFLTSLFAFIPYVGALASFLIGAVLVLLADPGKVLVCVIVYPVVQFIENQFIYPHVVGGSVGLAPLWTLIAALIGGKLFGLPGIIFFIPLAAVVYTLLREDVSRRLRERAAGGNA